MENSTGPTTLYIFRTFFKPHLTDSVFQFSIYTNFRNERENISFMMHLTLLRRNSKA